MENFIDQAHCVDLPGFDRLFRETLQVTLFIYLLSEEPRSLEICKNKIAGGGKKSAVKFVFFSIVNDSKYHSSILLSTS